MADQVIRLGAVWRRAGGGRRPGRDESRERTHAVARRRRTARGAAVVEFALLMPVLMLVIFGLIQYGLYFWAYQGGSDIARSAARLSATGDPATCSAFRSAVRGQIQDLSASGAAAARITRTYYDEDTGNPVAAGTEVAIGDTVQVQVSFTTFDLHMPFLPFIHDGRVTSTARSRVDYVPEGTQPEGCS